MIALAAANVAIVWAAKVLPFQDLSQHLAYAHILAGYGSNRAFQETYALAARFQPYFMLHYLLAWLGRLVSLDAAVRLVVSGYVIATFAAFDRLVDAVHGDGRRRMPLWSALLATLLVWTPVLCMGFLSFALCTPLFVWGCAAVVRAARPRARRTDACWVAACAGALCCLHVVAAGAYVMFAVLYALCGLRQANARRSIAVALACLATTGLVLLLWAAQGDVVGAPGTQLDWKGAIQSAQGLDFVNHLLRIDWHTPPDTLNYVSWTALGPFRWRGQVIVAVAGVVLWLLVRPARSATREVSPQFRRAAICFGLLSLAMPWGFYLPTEITYLNFRFLTLAFALVLALVNPDWFATSRARVGLVAFCAIASVRTAACVAQFEHEAKHVLDLLPGIEQGATLMPLVFNGKGSSFAKGIRVTHFLPMYATVFDDAVNAQFWGRYTPHLPVGFRPGKKLIAPPDWRPGLFDPTWQLRDAQYVLVQSAGEDDPPLVRATSKRVQSELASRCDLLRCEGNWCLYRNREQRDAHLLSARGAPSPAEAQSTLRPR